MRIFQYYCCMPEPERTIWTGLALAFGASLGAPVPAAPFDALWLSAAPPLGLRRSSFEANYDLGRAVVIDPVTELPEEVIIPENLSFWAEVITFLATPESFCADGCTLKSFP